MSKPIDATKQEQRNLMLAMLVILVLLFSLDFIIPSKKTDDITVAVNPQELTLASDAPAEIPVQPESVKNEPTIEAAVLPFNNDLVAGNVNISSGGLDSLELIGYKETTAQNSPNVTLLKPGAYWTSLNWVSPHVTLPNESDTWQSNGTELTPFSPLTLTYQNKDVKVTRVIAVDDAYMFTMTDTIQNLKNESISVALNGQINRVMTEEPAISAVHEGFLGVLNDKLVEKKYADVEDDAFQEGAKAGWMGLTDKYWQTVMIFDTAATKTEVGFHQKDTLYTAFFQTPSENVAAGQSLTRMTRLFAGVKQINLINAYQENLKIAKFDRSIDFGWFYFLTKPFLYFLNWLYAMVGNMGIAILIFATLLRIALLPIATKSYESMAKMRKAQPKIKALQERYKNNRTLLQQEMMNLYKRDKINPAGGCLPLLLQIPIFFALYKVLSVSINMRQAPFFGWIHDLSIPDPSSVFTAFGYLDWPIPAIINIGVWPLLMGLTMWVQQKLNPAPADKVQANMFKLMPIIFTFMLGHFAAGLVIYWTWSNVLSIAQQKYIMKKVGV